MTDNEKYQLEVFNKNIDQIKDAINIATEGKDEIENQLNECVNYLKELKEGKDFLKKSNAVVSMYEYAMIKKEIDVCNTVIRQHELKLNNLNNLIKDKNRDLGVTIEKRDFFVRSFERGKIIHFRGKDAKQK